MVGLHPKSELVEAFTHTHSTQRVPTAWVRMSAARQETRWPIDPPEAKRGIEYRRESPRILFATLTRHGAAVTTAQVSRFGHATLKRTARGIVACWSVPDRDTQPNPPTVPWGRRRPDRLW
eukprot:2697015-Pleurochrysis_carterae.AAC.2